MYKKILFFSLLTILGLSSFSQISGRIDRMGSKSLMDLRRQNSMFSVEPGATVFFGDYETYRPNMAISLGYEYYLKNYSRIPIFLGFKPFAQFAVYGGYDDRRGKQSKEDPDFTVDEFKSDMIMAGGLINIVIQARKAKFLLYGGVGPAVMNFNPKTKSGEKLPNNVEGLYSKTIFTGVGEVGLKFKIMKDLTLNFMGRGYYTFNNDNLDDVDGGLYADFLASGHIGVSFLFSSRKSARPIGWGNKRRKYTPRVRF